MATAVYKQALDIVASQVKTLADAVNASLTPEATIPVRALDWNDLRHNIIEVCWIEDTAKEQSLQTNIRDAYVYPCVVLMCLPKRANWDTRQGYVHELKQSIRSYYHNRRRMSAVSATGVNQLPCLVVDQSPEPQEPLTKNSDVHTLTILARFLQPRTA